MLRCMQGCHHKASIQQQTQCLKTTGVQLLEREALYVKMQPLGEEIPYNVPLTDIEDGMPQGKAIHQVVVAAKRGRTNDITVV